MGENFVKTMGENCPKSKDETLYVGKNFLKSIGEKDG